MMLKLLIVGATGLVGKELLTLALQDARVSRVIALTRRPLSARPKLENHIVDFDKLPPDASWWDVDAAVCALGTTKRETKSKDEYNKIDVMYPLRIATLVQQHGAKAFALTSSLGASADSASLYLKRKGQLEQGLIDMAFSSLTIVRPSFITGMREKPRMGERWFLAMLGMVEGILPKRYRSVAARDIARALLESVVNPKEGVSIRESETL